MIQFPNGFNNNTQQWGNTHIIIHINNISSSSDRSIMKSNSYVHDYVVKTGPSWRHKQWMKRCIFQKPSRDKWPPSSLAYWLSAPGHGEMHTKWVKGSGHSYGQWPIYRWVAYLTWWFSWLSIAMSDCQRVYGIFLQPVSICLSLKIGNSHHFPYENDRYWRSPAPQSSFFSVATLRWKPRVQFYRWWTSKKKTKET